MGQIKNKIEAMTKLVEDNPDNEFAFAVVVDNKEQSMSGFLQVPTGKDAAKKAVEALADMFFQRPDYAMMFAEAYRMYFYKLINSK